GFAAALARGLDEAAAIRFGQAAAAISVTRLGAQTSIPSREEVERALAGEA
ncbi:PfkB family carbohydrate kinase, partial [Pseudomonas aeruginosa]